MTGPNDGPICPHCGSQLRTIRLPEDAGYASVIHSVCFNNACSYYREGWTWMREKYNVNVSYRFRLDPATGTASPLAVWSETALVDLIVDPSRPA